MICVYLLLVYGTLSDAAPNNVNPIAETAHRVRSTRPFLRVGGRSNGQYGRLKELTDFIDDEDLFDLSKRQASDDYGHLRFGKRDEFDDYGHMRFGRNGAGAD